MNPVLEEISKILAEAPMIEDMDISDDPDSLAHYGVKRRSGRYPWGSGENPYQRSADFLARYEEYEKKGMSQKEIADEMGVSTTEIRVMLSHSKHERRKLEVDRAKSLKEDGHGYSEIARIMGYPNESAIRNLLNNENADLRSRQAENTAKVLAEELKDKGFLDVGKGAELSLGVSRGKMDEALLILQMDGYERYGIQVEQTTNKRQRTTLQVLCPPGTKYAEVYQKAADNEIEVVGEYHSNDSGLTFQKKQYPASIDSSRVDIRYADDGGKERDGLIEIRRGVEDLNLGNSHYAQVRILVDGTHYLKGMAAYSDNLPDGVDIVFNTSKSSDVPKMKVLKGIDIKDPNNPFGAYIKAEGQSTYIGKDGKEHLSAINKLKEEGDWEKQSRTLSSQFLSKQPIKLISRQLDLTYADYKSDYDTIMSLTNPTIRRKLLLDMADTCEGAAWQFKASALPRQKNQVILPVPGMKDDECYAPNFRDGEKVVLIRYPHGGTFELPELTVNNKNKQGIDIIGPNARDAVGINSKVAEVLSGADFDGDSVTVIPVNRNVHIKTRPPLEQLKGFDPRTEYAIPPGDTKTKRMSEKQKQKQMGEVSNLISDMTLRGAPEEEIARAVKHSMVVIDAVKHGLDYKRSEKENGIKELKQKWQERVDLETGETKYGGASTLISRHKQTVAVPETKGSGWIDKETGEVHYKESGRMYKDKKTGEMVPATNSKKLILAYDDVKKLSSGTPQEDLYAEYSNKMKALANLCRKSIFVDGKVDRLQKNSEAAKVFKDQVDSIDIKLKKAQMNAPLERKANIIANSKLRLVKQSNPDIDDDEEKKLRQIYIEEARANVGARSRKNTAIKLDDDEWEAIQAGAISDSKLMDILKYVDMTDLKQRSMPLPTTTLSDAKQAKIRAMSDSGYTNQEIADSMGVSVSTVFKYMNPEGENNG